MSNKILQYGDSLSNVCEVEHRGPEFVRDGWGNTEIVVKPATMVFTCTGFDDESIARLRKGGLFSIKKVIYNNPATIVIWEDGTKTVVKCQEGDTFDPEKGLLMCIAKKAYGNAGYFNDVLHEWVPNEEVIDTSGVSLSDLFGIFRNKTSEEEPSFDWEVFRSEKVAVNCKTKEAARDFLKEADKHGFRWSKNSEASYGARLWKTYGDRTCYSVDYADNAYLGYCHPEYYQHRGMEIIEWKVR